MQPTAADDSAVHADSVTASTHQAFKEASTVVTDSSALLQGVRLIGDVVHIDSIAISSHSETDGRGADKHSDKVTVSGVTVSGQPASIAATRPTVPAFAVWVCRICGRSFLIRRASRIVAIRSRSGEISRPSSSIRTTSTRCASATKAIESSPRASEPATSVVS